MFWKNSHQAKIETIHSWPKPWAVAHGWSSKIAQNVWKYVFNFLIENSDHTEIDQALATTLLSFCHDSKW